MKRTPAQLIKAELKKAFPTVKFSCTYKLYTGGDSVNVSWIDWPTEAEVRSITAKYQSGDVDSMIDCYEYTNLRDDIPQAKYVFEKRTISPEKQDFVYNYLDQKLIFRGDADEKRYYIASWARRIFSQNSFVEDKAIVWVNTQNDLLIFAP